MIGIVQLKRMMQLVVIILCMLFLFYNNARAQVQKGAFEIEKQTDLRPSTLVFPAANLVD